MPTSLILDQDIADGLDVIGDKWTILILRSAFFGVNKFEGFQKETGASRSTLTRRLNALIENEILYKHPYGQAQNRYEYKFTQRGMGLLGPSLLAAKWESDWQTEGYRPIKNNLLHSQCNKEMQAKVVCRACRTEIEFSDIEWPNLVNELEQQLKEIRSYNTQHRKRSNGESEECSNANVAELIGDRWTLLVLIAAFLGTQRYDDFMKRLSSPPGVLAERLKLMVANQIFKRVAYQNNPPRFNYTLSEKGQDLFPFVMMLRQWVAKNKASPLIHKLCQNSLLMDVVCDQCDQKPWPEDLRLMRITS